ncbi:MAG: hypothetical protein KME22_17730 [Hassallia sp. WJT32-NPBG1]|jgi:hypothetical protein|nr:hypothetical protein [Hassallia sp. WJT32-NPBG1]
MTIDFNFDSVQPSVRKLKIGFYWVATLFNLCLIAQVLTVGLAFFHNPEWWNIHVWLVRGYSGLTAILLLWVFLIEFPRRVQTLTASMAVLLGLQFLTIHLNSPFPLAVLHPLIGFTLFSVSTTLVHRVRQTVFGSNAVDILDNKESLS